MTYKLKTEKQVFKCVECGHEQYLDTYCLKCCKRDTIRIYNRCKQCRELIWGDNAILNGRTHLKCKQCERERKRTERAKRKGVE